MKKQKPIIIVVLVLVILLSTIFTASCATSAPSPKVPPKSNAIPKTKINQTHLTDVLSLMLSATEFSQREA